MSTTAQPSASHSNSAPAKQTACNPAAQVDSDPTIGCLTHAPLFVGLNEAQFREVASTAQVCFYSEEDILFLQDDPVRRVLVVAAGTVKITRDNKAGCETLLGIERAGDWLDDTIGPSQVHTVCARATEDCVLLAWDAAMFERLLERIARIERNMVRIMRTRLQAMQARFCDVSTLRAPQRLARTILHLGHGPRDVVSLSREEIAQMAGTSMFIVSRLLSSWAESKIVTLERGNVLIEDRDRLLELIEAS